MGSRKVVIPEFVIPYEKDFPFDSLERQLITTHPRLERKIIDEGRKVLKAKSPKDFANYQKWEDQAEDPTVGARTQAAARENLLPLYGKVQEAGKAALTPEDRKTFDKWEAEFYKPLNDDAENARKFLADLDRQNLKSKYRKTKDELKKQILE